MSSRVITGVGWASSRQGRARLSARAENLLKKAFVESRGSEFRIKVEERVKAALELGFDLLPRALDGVHSDVSLVAVGEFQGCIRDFGDFAFWQEPESVDECEVGHK